MYYGVIKEGKCYVLHKIKSLGNMSVWTNYYHGVIDHFETECGYKTFRELNHEGGNILGGFVDIERKKYDFGNTRSPDGYGRDYILNPTDIYMTNRKIKRNRYDELCPECFPNGYKEV